MKCPVCKAQFITVKRQEFDLSYCPSCHGVWLSEQTANQIIHMTSQTKIPFDPYLLRLFKRTHDHAKEFDGYADHYPNSVPLITRKHRRGKT